MTKFIVVSGGVVSGIGKGVIGESLLGSQSKERMELIDKMDDSFFLSIPSNRRLVSSDARSAMGFGTIHGMVAAYSS